MRARNTLRPACLARLAPHFIDELGFESRRTRRRHIYKSCPLRYSTDGQPSPRPASKLGRKRLSRCAIRAVQASQSAARHRRIDTHGRHHGHPARRSAAGPLLRVRYWIRSADAPDDDVCELFTSQGTYCGVPRCCGAFTPSTRLVSRRGGRGWSRFRF